MGKVYNRTLSDVVQLQDDEVVHEFCMIAHVHFRARSLSEAMGLLADHFRRVAGGDDKEHPFDQGSVTVGRVTKVHGQPEEVTLN